MSRGDDYKSSELDPKGGDRLLGQCTIDRIGGEEFGVAKKARFALYECGPNLDSFMSTMARIHDAIRHGRIAPAKADFVMNARMRFGPAETEGVMGERTSLSSSGARARRHLYVANSHSPELSAPAAAAAVAEALQHSFSRF